VADFGFFLLISVSQEFFDVVGFVVVEVCKCLAELHSDCIVSQFNAEGFASTQNGGTCRGPFWAWVITEAIYGHRDDHFEPACSRFPGFFFWLSLNGSYQFIIFRL
jgi:hypothetical protein